MYYFVCAINIFIMSEAFILYSVVLFMNIIPIFNLQLCYVIADLVFNLHRVIDYISENM